MTQLDRQLQTISERTVHALQQKQAVMAAAESCTGGMIASAVVGVDGASEVFWGSCVTYQKAAKHKMLGVSRKKMARYGLISRETAKTMAIGALHRSGADYAVAVTGLAGNSHNLACAHPVNETEKQDPDYGKPVGLVWIACASRKEHAVCLQSFHFTGNRNTIRKKAAIRALGMLLEKMF